MKLQCTVIEDLLPIYVDGICSQESEELIEEHLLECEACREMLAGMRKRMALPQQQADDLKPLQAIGKRWKQGKRAAFRKGVCITLAVLLVLTAALSGIWYGTYGKYYYQIAQRMDPVPEEAADFAYADAMKVINGCRIGIWIPPLLSNSGFIRATAENGRVLFVYPQVGGGYEYRVSVMEDSNRCYFIWLNRDLTANYEDHPIPVRTEGERARIDQLLMEQREEIRAMLAAVKILLEG